MESSQTECCCLQGPDPFLAVNTVPDQKRHILIVDDEFSNRLILRNILLQHYEIHECGNGQEALVSISLCKPDLILLDVMMPLMNGYDFCRVVKEDPETADIPILFITLLADSSQVIKAFDLGAADYLTKPFYGEEVLARIQRQFLIKEQRESLLQLSGELRQLVVRETQELIRARHHIAYGHFVQGIIHNLKNPSLVLTKGVERARKLHVSLAESYELEADLNSDLMETHLHRLDRAFNLMEKASARLSGIIDSLLHRSNTNQGTTAQLLDVNTVIHDEISFLEANPFFAYQVEKKIILSGEALPVAAVPSELAQLFNNLLSNAIDALQQKDKGGGDHYRNQDGW